MRAAGRGPGRPRCLRPTRGLRLRRFLLAANAQVSARSRSSERGSCRPQTGEAPERGGTDRGQREAGTAPHVPGSEEKRGFLDCCLSKRRAVTRAARKGRDVEPTAVSVRNVHRFVPGTKVFLEDHCSPGRGTELAPAGRQAGSAPARPRGLRRPPAGGGGVAQTRGPGPPWSEGA